MNFFKLTMPMRDEDNGGDLSGGVLQALGVENQNEPQPGDLNSNQDQNLQSGQAAKDYTPEDIQLILQDNELLRNRVQYLSDMFIETSNRQAYPQPQVTQPEPAKPKFEVPGIDLSEIHEDVRPAVKLILDKVLPAVTQPLQAKIDELETRQHNESQSYKQKEANKQVQDCMARFPDFSSFGKQMFDMSGQPEYAGLSIEDLYFLAKGRTTASSKPSYRPTPRPGQSNPQGARVNSGIKPSGVQPKTQPAESKDWGGAFRQSLEANPEAREALSRITKYRQ